MNICTSGDTAAIQLFERVLARLKDEPCCIGSAEDGVDGCTCWEPVYDLEQAPPIAVAAEHVQTRDEMCADCAFRPDSPERQGNDLYTHNSDDDLRALDHFWCHQGMRKPVAYRHPYGITLDADHDAYNPPRLTVADGERQIAVPFKASGAPADRCAGFDAWKRNRGQPMSDTLRRGPAGSVGQSHLEAHNALADHLNGHRPCPLCRAIVHDDDARDHQRSHVARAIGAR